MEGCNIPSLGWLLADRSRFKTRLESSEFSRKEEKNIEESMKNQIPTILRNVGKVFNQIQDSKFMPILCESKNNNLRKF
jgi:hypothetical protein